MQGTGLGACHLGAEEEESNGSRVSAWVETRVISVT